jgi:hypothetical protein
MKKTHLIFVIQAYNATGKFGDGSEKLEDIVILKLIDKTYAGALKRAQKIIEKNYYRLSEVAEFTD